MVLEDLIDGLALGIRLADATGPAAKSARTGAPFLPGIGPHSERDALSLALAALPADTLPAFRREVPYPLLNRRRCDVVFEGEPGWAVEVKMLRLMGDNGKPNDNMLMHILSPYADHRSAVSDCEKLATSGFNHRKALVIFGYDYPGWPMAPAIEAFEVLASRDVQLVASQPAPFSGLVHPVHQAGRVFGWEIVP